MGLTRRNTLIGLGVLAAGTGVISGSGAFDAVEANRSFEVAVDGDSGALLALEATNDVLADNEPGGAGGNDVIYFQLQAAETASDQPAVNEDAVTEFFGVFSITNNGSQTVEVSIDLEAVDGLAFELREARGDNSDVISSDLSLTEGIELSPGAMVSVDIAVDTIAEGGYVEADDPYQLTLTALSAAAQDA